MRESSNCLDRVTDALNWIVCSTDCDINVPRSHSPRKSLERDVIVITDFFGDKPMYFYLPATDEWFRLPANQLLTNENYMRRPCLESPRVKQIVSFRKTLLVVTDDITRSQCYDPDLNRWSPAPWTKLDSKPPFNKEQLRNVLVVENQICFIAEDCDIFNYRPTARDLWRYSFDLNSLSPLFKWVEKADFCAVAVEKYIYVIGGRKPNETERTMISEQPLSECARFNTEADEWQKIAPLNEARKHAFGVCKNEKIFIAGGQRSEVLKCCEVYNILTDEWQVIASLTSCRALGSMVLVDETLYVLGGFMCTLYWKLSDKIECYDHEKKRVEREGNSRYKRDHQGKTWLFTSSILRRS